MRKIYTTLLLAIGIVTMAHAAPVTRSAAQKTAAKFFGTATTSKKAPKMVSAAKRVASTQAAYYVFNASDKNSFVIVSGDDRTPQIIGYSKTEAFDTENLPSNIKAYLDGVKAQIDYLDRSDQKTKQSPARVATTHPIAPMLSSTWNQDEPYSDKCPKLTGSTEHYPTGCVATAMAQVLYYHKYPDQTTQAIPAYNSRTRHIVLKGVDANTSINWTNMIDDYSGEATDEQKEAVANLMMYLGRSVEMDYNTVEQGGSGAYTTSISPALRNYFGYTNAYDLDRSTTTQAIFQQKIYEELAANRPVILCGNSSGGGHCFVADGYDGDNYFHINWGWGGLCDGYFLLSLLNPDSNAGIGASTTTDGYTMYNVAILGVAPGEQAVTKGDPSLTFYYLSPNGSDISFYAYNLTGETRSFEYGLGYLNAYGQIIPIDTTTEESMANSSYKEKTFTMKGLANGNYKVYPISRVKDTDEWIYNPKNLISVTVNGDQYTSELASSTGHLSAEPVDFDLPATLLTGQSTNLKVNITNNGDAEFYGILYMYTSAQGSQTRRVANVGATLPAHQTTSVTIPFTLPSSAGTYTLNLYSDAYRSNLVGTTDITVTASTLSFTNSNIQATVKVNDLNVNKVYGHKLTGEITYKNITDTDFSGTLYAALADPNTYGVLSLDPTMVTIPAGSEQKIPFSFDGLESGTQLAVFGVLQQSNGLAICGSSSSFVISKGIEKVKSDGSIVNIAPEENYQVEDNDLAVDFTDADATVKTVTANNNPNTLYIFASSENQAATALKIAGKNVVIDGQADSIKLSDGHSFCSPINFSANYISYTRVPQKSISENQDSWETLALPFDATSVTEEGNNKNWFRSSADKNKDFWVMYFHDIDGNTVHYDYVSGDSIAANIPYLFAVPSNSTLLGKNLVFSATNTIVPSTLDNKSVSGSVAVSYRGLMRNENVSNAYVLNNDGTAFEKVTGNSNVTAFHAYFSQNVEGLDDLLNIAWERSATTLIRQLSLPETRNNVRYNLQGQRVDKNYKGIVIINGKKMVVK